MARTLAEFIRQLSADGVDSGVIAKRMRLPINYVSSVAIHGRMSARQDDNSASHLYEGHDSRLIEHASRIRQGLAENPESSATSDDLNLPTGVRLIGKRYHAKLNRDGVRHHLGAFATPEEAAAAIAKAREQGPREVARAAAKTCEERIGGKLPVGVRRNFNKFQARVKVAGVSKCLGSYDTPEEAAAVAAAARAARAEAKKAAEGAA